MEKNKILIVDDEPDIALILKLELEDAGYLTVAARDGIEALDLLGRESFDLVLLDIKMPRMDGMEVLGRIKKSAWELAVVMMTAHGCEDIAVEAMKNGALDYIAKPFSCEDMLQKVARAIQFNRTRQENLRLSRQLDEERRKMAAVLQGMADLLLAVDTEGRIKMANNQAARVLGIEQEALLGMLLEEALQADTGGDELPSRVVLRTAVPCLDVAYTILAGSANIPVLSSASPLINAAGELVGSVEIIRDISKLKVLEEEKDDFIGMLSHDLKSPITAIVGSIDLVREKRLGEINEEQREYLDSAVESCEEMVEMIDTLLGIHKFEAGKMQLSLKAEDPAQLVQRTLMRLQTTAVRGRIKLFTAVNEDLPPIAVDRSAFARILSNLLSNALKFTPEGGEIEVSAEEIKSFLKVREQIPRSGGDDLLSDDAHFVKIIVKDTGPGIPKDALENIFDRFAQAKTRRTGVTRGTGLGLTYCRKAMTAHHGYIWAESRFGKGSRFCMLFPVAE